MRHSLVVFVLLLVLSCQEKTAKTLKIGTYRGNIIAQDNQVMPFVFEVTSSTTLKIYNADEVIEVDEITYNNDSVFIKLPFFRTQINGVFDGKNIKGQWIDADRDRYVEFYSEYEVDKRFDDAQPMMI